MNCPYPGRGGDRTRPGHALNTGLLGLLKRPSRGAALFGASALLANLISAAPASAADSTATVPTKPSRFYWSVAIGDFNADENPGRMEHDHWSFGFSSAIGYRFDRRLSVEAELPFSFASVEAPALPARSDGRFYGDGRSIETWGLAVSLVASQPVKWFHPYVRAGAGLYQSRVSVSVIEYQGVFPFVFPVPVDREGESAIGFAPHVAAGANFMVSRYAYLGLEIRRLWMKGDFGQLSSGNVKTGGQCLYLTFGSSEFSHLVPRRRRHGKKPPAH